MRRPAKFTLVLFVMGLVFVLPGSTEVQGRNVTNAGIGKDGLIHILHGDGTEFVAPREMNQVSVEAPVIADDGLTVGWLVNFPNCCTSYPIPLVLVIYRDGRILRRITSKVGLPIFRWLFLRKGSEVAYFADTVHGNFASTCELRDVKSGIMLDEWYRGKSKTLPSWAEQFASNIGDLEEHSPN